MHKAVIMIQKEYIIVCWAIPWGVERQCSDNLYRIWQIPWPLCHNCCSTRSCHYIYIVAHYFTNNNNIIITSLTCNCISKFYNYVRQKIQAHLHNYHDIDINHCSSPLALACASSYSLRAAVPLIMANAMVCSRLSPSMLITDVLSLWYTVYSDTHTQTHTLYGKFSYNTVDSC